MFRRAIADAPDPTLSPPIEPCACWPPPPREAATGPWARTTWLDEFVASAISPELAQANIRWVEGPEAVAEFLEATIAQRQRVQSYATTGTAALLRRYQFLEAGGWVAYGGSLDDSPGAVPYLKPLVPRYDGDRDRSIKYETPPGHEARPLLPAMPWTYGLKIARNFGYEAEYQARYQAWQAQGAFGGHDFSRMAGGNHRDTLGILEDLPQRSDGAGCSGGGEAAASGVLTDDSGLAIDQGFWRWWQAKGSPGLIVAEGLKKALAAIEQGYPAIALRGITQWHPKGRLDLWPELAALAQGMVAIAFDQDDKLRTRAEVATQAQQLAAAIERVGGIPRFVVWDGAQGKGLDDVLVSLPPEQRRAWLDQAIDQALTLKAYRRVATLAKARAILAAPAPTAQRETTGEYLPPLPPLTRGAIHWVAANMGSGKTYRIGRDWVRPWAQAGGVTVVLSPLNSLGQQTAQDWGLPHLHDYGTDATSRQALEADISHRGGLVSCLNSAHRVLELIPSDRPLLLVIDEAAQVLTDAAEGGTLGGEWSARWEDAIALMQRAATTGAIVLAEDGLDQATIHLVKALSGAEQVQGCRHTRTTTPWAVTLNHATPLSGWRADLLATLQAGDRLLYVTTSQKEGRRLERWAQGHGIATHRIDSQTNEGGAYREFFETPEAWLYANQPQLVILSPSGKTGLSIEGGITAERAYFDSVWGYCPSLDTDTATQLLGRYRPPVPRHIWVPAYIQPEPGEAPGRLSITHALATEAARYAAYGGFGQAPDNPHDNAIKAYLAARRQRRWAQKVQAANALGDRLEASGHQVEVITEGFADPEVAATWDHITEALATEDSAYHAGLEIDPDTHTWAWANQVIRSLDSTYEQRCKAAKVRMLNRFFGLNWHDPQLWYDAVFCPRQNVTGDRPSRGPLAPGAALWAEAGHYNTLWAENAKEAATILGQRLKAAHLLPQTGPQAMLAAVFRPLVEKLLAAGEVVPGGGVEAQIKAQAHRLRAELRRYWRLSVTEDQSDTAIANKIARKFGLVLARERRVTVAGAKLWVYSITATATWRSLVAAREFALNRQGTNLLNAQSNEFVHPPSRTSPFSAAVTPPHPPDPSPPMAA